MTDKVRAYYPNAISGHLPAVDPFLSPVGHTTFENDAILLTPADTGKCSAVWLTDPIFVDNNTSFSSEFVVNMDPTGGAAPYAHGMSFTIQRNNASAIGGGGNGMGYSGISNSLTLEMDTCFGGVIGDNHLAITTGGYELTHYSPVTPSTDLNDGKDKFLWVDYDGATNHIKVYINTEKEKPGSPAIDYDTGSELTALLGGGDGDAWFGFTASTGLLYTEAHRVRSWHLEVDGKTKIRFPQQGETLEMHSLPADMMHGAAVTHYSRKDKKFYLYYIGPSSALAQQFGALVYRYDFDDGSWTAVNLYHASNKININFAADSNANTTNQRNQIAACAWGDEIFVFGGVHYSGSATNMRKSIAFNPDTGTYRELPDIPGDRNIASAIPYGPFIYLIGGSSASSGITGGMDTTLRYKP
jgi:hypothetical protein